MNIWSPRIVIDAIRVPSKDGWRCQCGCIVNQATGYCGACLPHIGNPPSVWPPPNPEPPEPIPTEDES